MRGLKPLDIGGEKMQLIKTRSGDDGWGSLKLKWQQSHIYQSASRSTFISVAITSSTCLFFFFFLIKASLHQIISCLNNKKTSSFHSKLASNFTPISLEKSYSSTENILKAGHLKSWKAQLCWLILFYRTGFHNINSVFSLTSHWFSVHL